MPSLCWLPSVQRNGGPDGKLGFQATCGDQGFLSFPGAPQRTSHEGSVSYHTPSWLLPQLRNSGNRDWFSAVYKASEVGGVSYPQGVQGDTYVIAETPSENPCCSSPESGGGQLGMKRTRGFVLSLQ